MPRPNWNSLNRRIEKCRECPRLVTHCAEVARKKRRAYQTETYWGGPVPNFGDPQARLLIIGLAPGAHGANRTGRMFTGDRSGEWLYRALHKAGFANQALSESRTDGLELSDCAITAVCQCAPPDNKPTVQEVARCRPFLTTTIEILPVKVFVALGQLAWRALVDYGMSQSMLSGKRPAFGHGAEIELSDDRIAIGSYHPSQQNTFTGRLTEKMFDEIFDRARQLLPRA